MNNLKNIAMLCSDTARSRAYIQVMTSSGLAPSKVMILESNNATRAGMVPRKHTLETMTFSDRSFDPSIPIVETLKNCRIPYLQIHAEGPNENIVIDMLSRQEEEFVVFSGRGGVILRKQILSIGKRFLHVHPGRLPQFRGSTTMYYSLLAEDKVTASAIFLERQIDSGPVIASKEYRINKDRHHIDLAIDPLIRADLLVEVLSSYARNHVFPEQVQDESNDDPQTYYIIHPLLKHLAILKP